MKKIISILAITFLFLLPNVKINAMSKTINTEKELEEALANESIDTIILGSDIETTKKINVMRNVTIDGNNKTIKYVGTFGKENSKDNTVWGGIYVLHFYKVEANLKNIKLTGGNAGILINGSKLNLYGTIDVSGNGFGGIELGKGEGITSIPELNLKDGVKIINTTETSTKPTIWAAETNAIVEINGIKHEIKANEEMSLADIMDLIDPENPKTSDNIYLYFTLLVSSIMLLMFSLKKVLKEN